MVWLPTLWFFILGSKPLAQWLGGGLGISSSGEIQGGNPIDRAFFSLLMLFALIVLVRRRFDWQAALQTRNLLVLFFAYCLVSILWSDFPWVALKRWVRALGGLLMAMVIWSEADPLRSFISTVKRAGFILVPLSIVLIKYFPHIGIGYSQWGHGPYILGVSNNKNTLGRMTMVVILLLLADYLFWRQKEGDARGKVEKYGTAAVFFMAIWVLFKSNSATSIAATFIGVSILAVLNSRYFRMKKGGFGYLVLVGLFVLVFLNLTIDIINPFLDLLGRDETLTGRTEVWQSLLAMKTDPLVGTGFQSFWLGERLDELWEMYWWRPTEAHNGFLEIYLNLGVVGLILFVSLLINTFRKISHRAVSHYEMAAIQMAFLIVLLAYNITEAGFELSYMMWFVFQILVFMEGPLSPESKWDVTSHRRSNWGNST